MGPDHDQGRKVPRDLPCPKRNPLSPGIPDNEPRVRNVRSRLVRQKSTSFEGRSAATRNRNLYATAHTV